MLMVISPAKSLDYDTPAPIREASEPQFTADAARLIGELRHLAPQDIARLMHLSDTLAELNYTRFQSWVPEADDRNSKQAVLAFDGDVYTGLDANRFTAADFAFAQRHLRILSGLYGLLRPLDRLQPYRLEMGTGFANQGGKNLYEFWGRRLTDALNEQLLALGSQVLVNLASNEYFKAVQPKYLQARIITPEFKDLKNGEYKIISFYAKKARGLMAGYVIRNRITEVEALKSFDSAGYGFNASLSRGDHWVFTRDLPA